MKHFLTRSLPSAVAVLLLGLAAGSANGAQPADRAAIAALAAAPLYFEADDAARFVARGQDCSVLLAPDSATLVLTRSIGEPARGLRWGARPGERMMQTRFVRLQLEGANPAAAMTGLEPMPGRANYFLGADPAAWRTGVRLFTRVQVDEVYPGIRMIYYADHLARLEYDFVLQPYTSPDRISFRVEGADRMKVDASGDLVLTIDGGEVRQHKPVIYQDVRGVRKIIPGGYRRIHGSTVGFWVGDYDRTLPLVIDPTLDPPAGFVTYLGGSKIEYGWGIARDNASGDIYVVGETLSSKDFIPLTNRFGIVNQIGYTNTYAGGTRAFGDAFIAKYDANGSNIFLSYFGGRSDDGALAVDLDSAGNVYVTGFTDSTNFPVLPNVAPMIKTNVSDFGARNNNPFRLYPVDAFVAKFNASGGLVYSALVGGKNRDGGLAIKVDDLARAYIAGITESSNFFGTNTLAATVYQPTNAGRADAFVAVVDAAGTSVLYSTYLGGVSEDHAQGIALDWSTSTTNALATAWVTGFTSSTNFPGTNNALLLVSMFGTNELTNTFNRLNNQAKISTRTDAFVVTLSDLGNSLPFSMFLGGSNDEAGLAITLDGDGDAYVTGYTQSKDFPTNRITTAIVDTNAITGRTNATITRLDFGATNFLSHVFVTKITNGNALGYSTRFGSSRADQGAGIAVNSANEAYVTGSTSSSNFAQVGVFFTTNGGLNVNFLNTNNPAFTDLRKLSAKKNRTTNDVFIVVLSSDGSSFVSDDSVLLGSNRGNDQANGIVINPAGTIAYLIGDTTSTNLATTNAWQSTLGGGNKPGKVNDAFVGKIEF